MHQPFGNSQTIGIECQATEEDGEVTSLWVGNVWLTVDGLIVGNTGGEGQEQIGIAVNDLVWTGRNTGKRHHPAMQDIADELALDLVMWAVYGDANEKFERMVRNQEELHVFEILPGATGPAFDDWEAIIIESGDTERFVWRKQGDQVAQSRVFPIGTFWRAAEEAKTWMDGGSDA